MIVNNLFIFVGPSASGKTTTENQLIDSHSFNRLVSSTSRSIRDSETDGIDYYFKSTQDCLSSDNAVEIKITDDWVYSLSVDEVSEKLKSHDKLIYSCINLAPAIDLYNFVKVSFPEVIIHLVFFDIDLEQRLLLLRARGDSDDDINLRLSREEDLYSSPLSPNLVITDVYTSVLSILNYLDQL